MRYLLKSYLNMKAFKSGRKIIIQKDNMFIPVNLGHTIQHLTNQTQFYDRQMSYHSKFAELCKIILVILIRCRKCLKVNFYVHFAFCKNRNYNKLFSLHTYLWIIYRDAENNQSIIPVIDGYCHLSGFTILNGNIFLQYSGSVQK